MLFSKRAILQAIEQGKVGIVPYDAAHIELAHVNLHLDTEGKRPLVVPAKTFAVAKTLEKITLAEDICGFMEGRAGLAKRGVSVEQSSTFIEPGTDNHMTLEIFNASSKPVSLEDGQPIAKMFLMRVVDNLGT